VIDYLKLALAAASAAVVYGVNFGRKPRPPVR
jgi:hypothetical protein